MKNFFKKHAKPIKIIGVIFFALIFYFAGYLVGHKNLVFEEHYRPTVASKELLKPRSVDFSIFWEAWNKVMEKYVGTPDAQKMIYGAISGMMQSLGDPYSVFMQPSESKSFLEDLSGEISGIGAEMDIKDNKLLIIAPLADSPAEKAGLKPQDQVLKINDESTENMTLEEAVSKIRGQAGSKVSLTIIRAGWEQPQRFEITREKIQVKSVKWEMRPDNIAYIQINQFGDDTTDLMQEVAQEIKAKSPKAIILDLRNNPGGYLESAVDTTSLFMPSGVVVKEQYRDGHIDEEKTTLEPILKDYKLIILINQGSASASEIVAGALQDAGRATLVGEKTFGKGSVQDLEEITGGSTLRLTVAKWLTPKGRAIDQVGIEPDIKIDLTEDDQAIGRDPQLDKAIELVK